MHVCTTAATVAFNGPLSRREGNYKLLELKRPFGCTVSDAQAPAWCLVPSYYHIEHDFLTFVMPDTEEKRFPKPNLATVELCCVSSLIWELGHSWIGDKDGPLATD